MFGNVTNPNALPLLAKSSGAARVKYKHAAAATVRTLEAKLHDIPSVKDFGALGDGVTDDTAAFTAAKAAGAYFVPPGSYAITGTITGDFVSFGAVSIVGGAVETITDTSLISGSLSTINATLTSTTEAVEADVSKYSNGVNFLRTLRAGSLNFAGGVDCKGDVFFDASGVNTGASINENHDNRGAYVPTRQYSNSVASEGMDSLVSWTQIKTDTGDVQVVSDPSTDPAIGNVYQFTTGANLNSVGGAQKDLGSVPASFGIQFLVKLNAVGSDPNDAL